MAGYAERYVCKTPKVFEVMKLYIKNIITLAILCTSFVSLQVSSAKFEWMINRLKIEGEIVPGDYDRLIEIIKYIGQPPINYILNSRGGDVMEAIKIGTMIRDTYTPVSVPDNAVCASACFFILVGSPNRSIWYATHIGIHRPYFNKLYFSSLSASEAENKYRKLQATVKNYLLNMGVPQSFTDMMYTISSDDVNWISAANFEEKIGKMSPFYEELLISKCGHELTDDEFEILTNKDKKYSEKLSLTVYMQYTEYIECEMNMNSKEVGRFMKKLGIKAKKTQDSFRWVGLNVTKSNNK